ncbi:MAG: helix-turn-helix transcriptional regulator [Acidobacteriaceae bacterium]|nr:helix-turn-helix transcriptional regulator [Acidobacteriaceae bacterium]
MRTDIRITGPILKLLREFICSPLEQKSGADIALATGLASGTLYPILARLEAAGWLTSEWENVDPSIVKRPRRRLYQLTTLGAKQTEASFREHAPMKGVLAWQ